MLLVFWCTFVVFKDLKARHDILANLNNHHTLWLFSSSSGFYPDICTIWFTVLLRQPDCFKSVSLHSSRQPLEGLSAWSISSPICLKWGAWRHDQKCHWGWSKDPANHHPFLHHPPTSSLRHYPHPNAIQPPPSPIPWRFYQAAELTSELSIFLCLTCFESSEQLQLNCAEVEMNVFMCTSLVPLPCSMSKTWK